MGIFITAFYFYVANLLHNGNNYIFNLKWCHNQGAKRGRFSAPRLTPPRRKFSLPRLEKTVPCPASSRFATPCSSKTLFYLTMCFCSLHTT
jgi:hypothetical protein